VDCKTYVASDVQLPCCSMIITVDLQVTAIVH
jgi:hypothetical protein